MKFSGIVSGLNMAYLTEIALILFLAVFIVIIIRLFRKSNQPLHAALADLPLHELPANNLPTTERSRDHGRA